MMNLMLNTLNPAPAPAGAAPAAGADAAPADATPATGAAVPDSAALPFAQWLGQQADAMLAADAAAVPDDGAVAEAAAPQDDAKATTEGAADGAGAPAASNPLLAAMAIPLIAVALPIAAAQQLAPSADGTPAAGPRIAAASAAPRADGRTGLAPRADAGAGLAAAPVQAQAAGTDAGVVASPAVAALQNGTPETAPAPAAANRSALAANASGAAQDAATAPSPPQAAAGAAPWGVSAPAAPQQGAAAGTVMLAGPPAAWRQTLHEALGERLQLQLGNNMEQAVIRLEPPMLGRVEIAIRHAAGALEVTLSATHGEVLRQLQTVSDNLRNDLAQRQYTEVTVTVTPAPRSAAANQFAGDPHGRGRQGGRPQEDNTPGLALLDADNPASTFSLNGRG